MKLYNHPSYKPHPGAEPGVEAIRFTGPEEGKKIVDWIEAIRGYGAALYEDGTLIVPAEEFGRYPVPVPAGWYVYRKGFSDRFHVAPENYFEFRYNA